MDGKEASLLLSRQAGHTTKAIGEYSILNLRPRKISAGLNPYFLAFLEFLASGIVNCATWVSRLNHSLKASLTRFCRIDFK